MHFLYGAIKMKQLEQRTLKVSGKYLTTVLWMSFILFSFPLALGSLGKPFLHQGKSFTPTPADPLGRTTSKIPLFLLAPIFEDISTPRLESTKW